MTDMPALPPLKPWYRDIWAAWSSPLVLAALTPSLLEQFGILITLGFWSLQLWACAMLVRIRRDRIQMRDDWEHIRALHREDAS